MNWKDIPIDKSWTLFLDRDGVINKKIDNDYVRNLEQFEWQPGAIQAIVKLSAIFGKIIVVTNQQGVGKGLMTQEAVESIHDHLVQVIQKQGGKIDRVYFSPHLKSENSHFRKPEIGMALQAKSDFPDLDLRHAVMVGDSVSDMEFGRKAGMKNVFITNNKPLPAMPGLTDSIYTDLTDFASQL